MIRLILNAKSKPYMCKTSFDDRRTYVGGVKVLTYSKMSRYESLCVIHKYLDNTHRIFCFMFVKVILRNAKE